MSKINWDDYKEEILALDSIGLSSMGILIELEKKYGKMGSRNLDRSVRACLVRWRGTLDGYTPQSKVLIFDLETAPLIAYTWGIWNVNINTDFIIRDWFVFCWSAKWLFDDKIMSEALTPKEIKKANDKRIIKKLWKLFDEADVIVAHNLDKFDEKRSKTRFLKHDLKLPSPYSKVDTLKVARRNFNIISNRLDYIGKDFLGIGGKMETPRGLWQSVDSGDEEAMATMVEYCERDVQLLEDVYLYLRPYHRQHPNISLMEEDDSHLHCKTCASSKLTECGEHKTMVAAYTAYRCGDCGSISYGRKTQIDKEHSKNILK
jgi:DNA polymerase elongation subunit (family B)